MNLPNNILRLESELERSVAYLSSLNVELESVYNVVDSVCIDYICANKAVNGNDSETLLLYQRLEKWRHHVDQISQILSLHRENKFVKSEAVELQFMDLLGLSNDTISNDCECYKNVARFKRGIISLKLASYFAKRSNSLSELISSNLIKTFSDSSNYKECLRALSEISRIFKYVISDSAFTTSMNKGGESVFANNILRQFLKQSVDSTETYINDYKTASELALVELIRYVPMDRFVEDYKNAVKSVKSQTYDAAESPITFYLFNMERKVGVGSVIENLRKKGFISLIGNYIHPHDVHSYYFDITTTRDILEKIHGLQCKLIQTSLLEYSLGIIKAIVCVLSAENYPKDIHLNEAIYRAFMAVSFMISEESKLSSIWSGMPFVNKTLL